VVAEPPHGTGFASDAGSACVIQFLSFDEAKGHIPVNEGVMDEVDSLLAALTQEFLDLISAISKGGGIRWRVDCFRRSLN